VVAASCSARTTLPDSSALGTADDNATGLSSSSIAAIVCGVVTGVAVLLSIILILRRRRKKAHYLPPNIMYVEIDDASQTAVAELAPDSLPGPSAALWRKKKRSPASTHSDIHELPPDPPEKSMEERSVPLDQSSVSGPASAATPSATTATDQDDRPEEIKAVVTATLERSENEGEGSIPTREDELASLEQRRVQLAERKWRLMELDRIEDEEAEIERRLTRLRDTT
jgi:hypothetical protein